MFANPQDPATLVARETEWPADVRGDYFRDQTALLHCLDFRRLKRKTQVFFDPDNDHVCTRIEHVLHVSSVAATIAKGLGLDVELSQAIGMGHDIGHAPFGHAGERVLDDLLGDIGGFVHELHGLRVVDRIAGGGHGLNLTYAVRDGIVSHCGEKWEQAIRPDPAVKDLAALRARDHYPATWEGCVVRVSDKIAYLGRDVEDAITARLVSIDEIPPLAAERLGRSTREIINTLVLDVIAHSERTGAIGFSDGVNEAVLAMKEFNYRRIYAAESIQAYQDRCRHLLQRLTEHLLELFDRHGMGLVERDDLPADMDRWFARYVRRMGTAYTERGEANGLRIVGDYVAGMTDDFALRCFHELVMPAAIRFR